MTGPDEAVQPERAPRELAIIHRWAGVAAILLLIAGSFAIAYLRAASAADTARKSAAESKTALHSAQAAATKARKAAAQAQATADCVNRVLAERDKLTGELHRADVTRVKGQNAAETTKGKGLAILAHATTTDEASEGVRLYVQGEAAFKKTLADYIATSNTIRAEQLQHPLGKC